jgi:hypothetical protein
MNDIDFKAKIICANHNEAVVSAALARKFNCSVKFPAKQDRDLYDYALFNYKTCTAKTIEQKDSRKPDLLLELLIYNADGSTRAGWFSRDKQPNYLLWNSISSETLFLCEFAKLKAFTCNLEKEKKLNIIDYRTREKAWVARNQSCPVRFALLPLEDIKCKSWVNIFTYKELNIQKDFIC